MKAVSSHLDPSDRRQLGLRVHPEVRRALRVMAAQADETMEDTLHRILARELCSRGLLPAASEPGIRKSGAGRAARS